MESVLVKKAEKSSKPTRKAQPSLDGMARVDHGEIESGGASAGMPAFLAASWAGACPEGLPSPKPSIRLTAPARIQRKCAACDSGGDPCPACLEEEEEETPPIQRRPALSAAPSTIQRQPDDRNSSSPPPPPSSPADAQTQALIVEDEAGDLDPGQMRKSAFLAQLKEAAAAAAEEELQHTPWISRVRPAVDQWAGQFTGQSAQGVELTIRRLAPGASGATTAGALIPPVAGRVRQEIRRQVSIGGMMESAVGTLSSIGQSVGGAISSVAKLLFKRKDRNAPGKPSETAADVHGALGEGASLDARLTGPMSAAYGHDFSNVRIHTDAAASWLAARYNSRAFTLGSHIAFASGEYQPGTPVGDALVAHELAHVVQQSGADLVDRPLEKGGTQDAFEEEADNAAVSAVASVWRGTRLGIKALTKEARTRLKTGLRLQSCTPSVKRCPPGKSWQVAGQPAGVGSLGCICTWRCLPGGITTEAPSGPSIQCDPPGSCPQPSVETVADDYRFSEQGSVTGYGAHWMAGDPMTGTPMCGCLPLDIEGKPSSTQLVQTGFDPTNMYAGPLPGSPAGHVTDTTEAPHVVIVEPATRPGEAVTEVAPAGVGGVKPAPPAAAPQSQVAPIPPAAANQQQQPQGPGASPAPPTAGRVPAPGGPPAPGGTGVMLRTVTGSTVIVDSNIAISLDRQARGLPLNDAQRANVEYARSQGVFISTPETARELAAGGGAAATVPVTQEVPISSADRSQIVTDLEAAGVGGGAPDREVVTQALLAQSDPGVTPTLATADRGVINPLARLAGIPVDRLGTYRNVAEWLNYQRGTDSFVVTIRGRNLRVRPVQPVRAGPLKPGGKGL